MGEPLQGVLGVEDFEKRRRDVGELNVGGEDGLLELGDGDVVDGERLGREGQRQVGQREVEVAQRLQSPSPLHPSSLPLQQFRRRRG